MGMPRRLAYGLVAVTVGYLLVEPLLTSSFHVLEWPVVKIWATSHETTLVTAADGLFLGVGHRRPRRLWLPDLR